TISPRRITSIVRGMLPVGISCDDSCNFTFCQSTKVLRRTSSCHAVLLPHVGLGHCAGSVYLKLCSTSLTWVLHSLQINVPNASSGRTSDVRVTVPDIERSLTI